MLQHRKCTKRINKCKKKKKKNRFTVKRGNFSLLNQSSVKWSFIPTSEQWWSRRRSWSLKNLLAFYHRPCNFLIPGTPLRCPPHKNQTELTGPVVSHKSYLNNLFGFLFWGTKKMKRKNSIAQRCGCWCRNCIFSYVLWGLCDSVIPESEIDNLFFSCFSARLMEKLWRN